MCVCVCVCERERERERERKSRERKGSIERIEEDGGMRERAREREREREIQQSKHKQWHTQGEDLEYLQRLRAAQPEPRIVAGI